MVLIFALFLLLLDYVLLGTANVKRGPGINFLQEIGNVNKKTRGYAVSPYQIWRWKKKKSKIKQVIG